MVIWAKEDTPQSVASALWGTVFSVPQISLRFKDVTPVQKKVLKFFLDFWVEHRETLLTPEIKPTPAGNTYGYVTAQKAGEKIVLCNVSAKAETDSSINALYMINNSGFDTAILKCQKGEFKYSIYDCTGKKIGRTVAVKSALTELSVPFGGLLKVERI